MLALALIIGGSMGQLFGMFFIGVLQLTPIVLVGIALENEHKVPTWVFVLAVVWQFFGMWIAFIIYALIRMTVEEGPRYVLDLMLPEPERNKRPTYTRTYRPHHCAICGFTGMRNEHQRHNIKANQVKETYDE